MKEERLNIIMKKKRIMVSGLLVAICLTVGSISFAAWENWTSYETSTVGGFGGSTTSSHRSCKIAAKDKKFAVTVKDKTMWSAPTAKLVNSEGVSRSNKVVLNDTDKKFTGSGSTAEKNHLYKLKITSALNQIGDDTIKYQFTVH